MLDVKAAERIFPIAEEWGYREAELYSEQAHSAIIEFHGRTDRIRFLYRQGTSLHATREGVDRRCSIDSNDEEALVSALAGRTVEASTLRSHPEEDSAPPALLLQAVTTVLQHARSAFASQNEKLHFPFVSATLTVRNYQVARAGEALCLGREENAELNAQWKTGTENALIPFAWDRARASLSGLFAEVASGLSAAVRLSLNPSVLWPVPAGLVPMLWSPRAVSKIQMLFLQAFEGDRVLGNQSFLTDLTLPLPLLFSIEDCPDSSLSGFDHEGSIRKGVFFFRQGRPTALACNKQIAKYLDVAPTGHARRQSFESSSTVGFWHPHLRGLQSTDGLLANMRWGLSIQDLDVVHFDPASNNVALRVSPCFLVHNGAQGEPVEPFTLRLPLLQILEAFEGFEKQAVSTGFAVGKNNQRLFTEVSAPCVLSRPLPVPGTVPLRHYW